MLIQQAPKKSKHQAAIRRATIAGISMIALFSGTIGLWAAAATLSGAVMGGGQFVVDTSVKKIQHGTGGIVGELNVREGQRVREGDLLVRLDETVTRANLQVVSKQLDEFVSRQARLEAERDSLSAVPTPPEFTNRLNEPAIAKIMSTERTLFDARRAARDAQKDQLRKRISQSQDEIKGLRAQQDSKASEAAFIAEELKGVRELYEKNLVQLPRLNALERDGASIEGQRGQLIAAVAQAEGRIAETSFQMIQVDEQMRAEAMQELREMQGKIAEYTERKIAAEDQLKRTDIRSPSTGFVHQLNVHTVGGVISPAEPVMLIVPENDELDLEARDPAVRYRPGGHRPEGLGSRPCFPCALDPGAARHGVADFGRRHQRSAHRRLVLYDPRRAAGGRDQASRPSPADRRHAGGSLRRGERTHPVRIPQQAPDGAGRAGVPRALRLNNAPHSQSAALLSGSLRIFLCLQAWADGSRVTSRVATLASCNR